LGPEFKLFDNFAHRRAVGIDVEPEIFPDVFWIIQKLFEIVLRSIVKAVAAGLFQNTVRVLQLPFILLMFFENIRLCFFKRAIQPAQDREGQDNILIFGALKIIAQKIGDAPDKINDMLMIDRVHRLDQLFILKTQITGLGNNNVVYWNAFSI